MQYYMLKCLNIYPEDTILIQYSLMLGLSFSRLGNIFIQTIYHYFRLVIFRLPRNNCHLKKKAKITVAIKILNTKKFPTWQHC